MRQAVMTAPGVIEFRDVPKPVPGPGEILLRIQRIGICGSDIHVNHGKHPFTRYPVVQGHEFSGVIEETGPSAGNFVSGTKVTARPQVVCGKCKPCRRGDYNICDVLKVEGFQAPGCAQDYFITRPEKLVPLPDSLSFEEGAMVEPVAVAVHATWKAGDLSGKNVVVMGAGTIGNLTAQAAKSRGARKVLIIDYSEYRLNAARDAGCDEISNASVETIAEAARRAFGEEGFSVAFEAAGAEDAMAAAVAGIEKGGRIVALGVFGDKPRIDMSIVGDRELELIGTLMYKHEDYLKAVELIRSGKIQTRSLVTKHFPFENYADAYRYIDAGGDKTLKVMIDL